MRKSPAKVRRAPPNPDVLMTLVAPMFPLPSFLGSGARRRWLTRIPKGTEPKR